MSADIVEKLQEKATVLTQERKRRGKTVPEELATVEQVNIQHNTNIFKHAPKYQFANTKPQVREWVALSSHPGLHSASVPGILAVDLSTDNTRILTGGADKTATVFNKDTEQVVAALKGHQKKVNKDMAITAAATTRR